MKNQLFGYKSIPYHVLEWKCCASCGCVCVCVGAHLYYSGSSAPTPSDFGTITMAPSLLVQSATVSKCAVPSTVVIKAGPPERLSNHEVSFVSSVKAYHSRWMGFRQWYVKGLSPLGRWPFGILEGTVWLKPPVAEPVRYNSLNQWSLSHCQVAWVVLLRAATSREVMRLGNLLAAR